MARALCLLNCSASSAVAASPRRSARWTLLAVAVLLVAAIAASLVASPAPAQAAPAMKEGKAYVASISWSRASGTSFTGLLHKQAVVLRQDGVYWIGLASASAAADKKITKLTYGGSTTAAATEPTDDNTRVFMFPVASIDTPVVVGVEQSGKKGTARLSINTSTLKLVPTDAQWTRLEGAIALDTMEAVVKAGFSKSRYAILATSAGYWDALSASGLAGIYQCPIVLTDPNGLSAQAGNRLKAMGTTDVIIVGGTAAISKSVENTSSSSWAARSCA